MYLAQCYCTTSNSNGYDSCDATSAGALTGPDNPTDLNIDANISAGWESGDLYISVDTTSQLVGVMPVPANNGEWESVSELNSYLSDLLGTTVDVTNNTAKVYYQQKGSIARWDAANEQWALQQFHGNLLLAAITSATGELVVDHYRFRFDGDPGCTTAAQGEFAGEQCTVVADSVNEGCDTGFDCDCDNPQDCFPMLLNRAESVIYNFELSSGPYLRYDAYEGALSWSFRRSRVLADEADMQNLYYNLLGNLDGSSADYPSKEYNTDASSSGSFDVFGACGFGYAKRENRVLQPVTFAGTAPATVSGCNAELP